MLHMAVMQNNCSLLLALFKHPDLKINQLDSRGETALEKTFEYKNIELSKVLLKRNDISLEDLDLK